MGAYNLAVGAQAAEHPLYWHLWSMLIHADGIKTKYIGYRSLENREIQMPDNVITLYMLVIVLQLCRR